MVGAAGLILTQIMCVAMNRSLLNVLVGGFGVTDSAVAAEAATSTRRDLVRPKKPRCSSRTPSRSSSCRATVWRSRRRSTRSASSPTCSKARGTKVTYAIHPVAGRMPGHMNVLLAEADVPYEQLLEMDVINSEFKNTDVVIVLGANDVVNPAATKDPSSPIAGMPILNAHEARSVFVVKRSLSPGYAGIKNELFEYDNTMMVFGDAKKVLQDLIGEVKDL